jgi:predicted ribosome quality control (RQC) complex YloA/Tae2 family protein
LTTAGKNDIWFHTKLIHGSHTILFTKGKEVGEQSIYETAQICAYHSKGRQSSNVPVDYTEVKNVKKPNGAKPGMVIYDFYNTVYVTPIVSEVEKLKC